VVLLKIRLNIVCLPNARANHPVSMLVLTMLRMRLNSLSLPNGPAVQLVKMTPLSILIRLNIFCFSHMRADHLIPMRPLVSIQRLIVRFLPNARAKHLRCIFHYGVSGREALRLLAMTYPTRLLRTHSGSPFPARAAIPIHMLLILGMKTLPRNILPESRAIKLALLLPMPRRGLCKRSFWVIYHSRKTSTRSLSSKGIWQWLLAPLGPKERPFQGSVRVSAHFSCLRDLIANVILLTTN